MLELLCDDDSLNMQYIEGRNPAAIGVTLEEKARLPINELWTQDH